MNEIIQLLNHYGYIVLFLSLLLELIIVPIPNEALMSYVGVLCYQGKMNIILSILFAGVGGVVGATISYWIGYKLGVPFFRKFGHYFHMGPEKMERMSKWYGKYGKVLLIISYFIPGVRHIASIITGVIKLPFVSFCIFSYIGVFLWVGTFIALGNVFGPQWDQYQGEIKKWVVLFSIVIGFFALIYFIFRTNKNYIKESIVLLHQAAFRRFKSFLKIKFLILFIFILFITFFTLMVGLIQDLISNEFGHLNIIVNTLIFTIFNVHWHWIMYSLFSLSSWKVLGSIALITIVVVFINRKNKWLELTFFVSTLIGGVLFSKGIRWIFQYMLSKNNISPDFPNSEAALFVMTFAFFFIMMMRHSRNYFYIGVMFFVFIFILAGYFISGIYVHHLKPSDLLAGYVFSAVWVTGMVFTMEMFRLISLIKSDLTKDK